MVDYEIGVCKRNMIKIQGLQNIKISTVQELRSEFVPLSRDGQHADHAVTPDSVRTNIWLR